VPLVSALSGFLTDLHDSFVDLFCCSEIPDSSMGTSFIPFKQRRNSLKSIKLCFLNERLWIGAFYECITNDLLNFMCATRAWWSVLECAGVCRSVLECVGVCWILLQRGAVWCGAVCQIMCALLELTCAIFCVLIIYINNYICIGMYTWFFMYIYNYMYM